MKRVLVIAIFILLFVGCTAQGGPLPGQCLSFEPLPPIARFEGVVGSCNSDVAGLRLEYGAPGLPGPDAVTYDEMGRVIALEPRETGVHDVVYSDDRIEVLNTSGEAIRWVEIE